MADELSPEGVKVAALALLRRSLETQVGTDALDRLEVEVQRDVLVKQWVEKCVVSFLGHLGHEETVEMYEHPASAHDWIRKNLGMSYRKTWVEKRKAVYLTCPHLNGDPDSLHLSFLAATRVDTAAQLAVALEALQGIRRRCQCSMGYGTPRPIQDFMRYVVGEVDRTLSKIASLSLGGVDDAGRSSLRGLRPEKAPERSALGGVQQSSDPGPQGGTQTADRRDHHAAVGRDDGRLTGVR